jgi:hypothetical protein
MILLKATTTPYDVAQGILAQYPLAIQDGLTAQINIEEVKVLCQFPSGGGDVILPLTTFGNNIQNMKVLVANGDLVDNVTVIGATPSGGSQEVVAMGGVNVDVKALQTGKFEVVTSGVWTCRLSN